MVDARNAEITTTAVYNRLRGQGEMLHFPLKDEDVEIITKETIKLIKAQLLVKQKLAKLGLLKG